MRLVRPWTSVGRRKTFARAGIGVALVALLAVTGLLFLRRPSPAQLIVPGHMNDVTEVDPGYRYPTMVLGGVTFCLDKPGRVHVTSVVRSDGSLDVTGWAVHEYFGGVMAGDALGTLAANGLNHSPDPLTLCAVGASPNPRCTNCSSSCARRRAPASRPGSRSTTSATASPAS